ncbi:MAG: hypothetical protein Q8P16_01855, partial [bacterium]|nr:hypothetical protein [bacterium]
MSLENILRGVVLTGVFALPLIVFIVASSLFFPYITGKNFAFRAIVEVMFAAWLLLSFMKAEYRPRLSALFISLAAFIGIVALA